MSTSVPRVTDVTAVPRVTIQMDLTYASATVATQETDALVEVCISPEFFVIMKIRLKVTTETKICITIILIILIISLWNSQ